MNKTTKAILAALLGHSIFGFSFLFSKVALNIVSPYVLLSIRFIVAFLVLNLLLCTGKFHIDLKGKPVKYLLLLGLLQPVIYFICESYGISMTTAAFSGVMIGLVPVVGLVLGVLFLKEKCTLFQVICTVMSVVGVSMTSTGGFGTVSWAGFLFLLGAVLSGVLFTILNRSISDRFSAFERTYVMFALGSVFFTAIALVENGGMVSALIAPIAVPEFLVSVIYLAVVSSVCAFLLINYSVNYVSAGKVMIFANFTTVISVLAGIFIMGDRFAPVQLVGIVIITLSVFGVSYPQKAESK